MFTEVSGLLWIKGYVTQDVILCPGALREHVTRWAVDTGAQASREDRRVAGTGQGDADRQKGSRQQV